MALSIQLLRKVLAEFGEETPASFRMNFSDGSHFENKTQPPEVVFHIKHPRAERRMVLYKHIGLLDSYFDGDIDIEGDFAAAFRAGMDSNFALPGKLVSLKNWWHELRLHSRSQDNARFHYGLNTDFYRYWLDQPLMMYTCAYWKEGTQTLEQAQRNKADHVCRKLQLKPGETMADVGCGWGGLMFHAQEHFGAKVTGYNLTTEQVAAVDKEIARKGLQHRLQIREQDARSVTEQYDKVAYIGVLEHAGRDNVSAVVKSMSDTLKPGGLGIAHFVGHVGQFETDYFIRKHIFPGGWIPSLAETIQEMERHGLEVLDIENLRRHYAVTLDCWAERFDEHWPEIQRLNPQRFDERFKRLWRTYLYGCAELFRSQHSYTHLFQIVFSKGNVTDAYPMSRLHMYECDLPERLSTAGNSEPYLKRA